MLDNNSFNTNFYKDILDSSIEELEKRLLDSKTELINLNSRSEILQLQINTLTSDLEKLRAKREGLTYIDNKVNPPLNTPEQGLQNDIRALQGKNGTTDNNALSCIAIIPFHVVWKTMQEKRAAIKNGANLII